MKNYYRLAIFLPLLITFCGLPSFAFDPSLLSGQEFIENKGQITDKAGNVRNDILFYTEGKQHIVYFGSTGISYVTYSPNDGIEEEGKSQSYSVNRTDVNFVESASPSIYSYEEIEFKRNYYLKHCPEGITNVRAFKKIRYENVWQGIDLEFYYDRLHNLKYDYIVKPSADPNQIKLEYKGHTNIEIDGTGNLLISNEIGSIKEKSPFTYQRNNTEQSEIGASYNIASDILSFDVAEYNRTQELIIDPAIQWSTFYGGILADRAFDMIYDSNSDLVINGNTFSLDFPITPGTEQITWAGDYDGFILKMTKEGQRKWATFFGGSKAEYNRAIAEDKNFDLIIVGYTWSDDLPVNDDAFQTVFRGGFDKADGFIAKFDLDGKKIWSTYYGGKAYEHFYDVDTDSEANIIFTGWTASSDFQVEDNDYKRSFIGRPEQAILAKFSSDGQYIWATHFSGTQKTHGWGVAVDANDDIYFTGDANGEEFPITFNQNSTAQNEDCFLAKFSKDCEKIWARLYGGRFDDRAKSLVLMVGDTLAITGDTRSDDLDLGYGQHQTSLNSGGDCLVATFENNGNLLWATYWGGSLQEQGIKINKDYQNNIIVAGFTSSPDFPITSDLMDMAHNGRKDAMVLKFTLNGDSIFWSTALGGTNDEQGEGIAADDSARVYVSGFTQSGDFPIVGDAFQDEISKNIDVFIARLCATNPDPKITVIGSDTLCEGAEAELDAGVGFVWYEWSTGETTQKITVTKDNEYYVTVSDSSGCEATSEPIRIYVFPNPEVEISGEIEICEGDTTELSVEGQFDSYLWSDNSEGPSIKVHESGRYSVSVIDSIGCVGYAEVNVFLHPLPVPKIKGPDEVCSFTQDVAYYLDNNHNNHQYYWEIVGGTLISGQGTKFIYVDWGATGTGNVILHDTTAFGCIGSDTMLVTIREELIPMIISSVGSFVICEGDTITLSTKNQFVDYLWNDEDKSATIEVWEEGSYKVWVRDKSGCEGENSVQITVIPSPNDTIIGPLELCFGDDVYKYYTYQQGNHGYEWEVVGGTIISGQNTHEIDVRWNTLGIGKVILTGTDTQTGCSGDSEVEVTIYDNPTVNILYSETLEFCEGDSVVLSFDGIFNDFYWEDTSKEYPRIIRTTGTYTLTVIDNNGCEASDEVNITVYPLPPKPTITDLGGIFESTAADAYQWYLGGIQIGGETSQQFTPTQDGAYQVEVFDENGCSNISDPINFESGKPYASVSIPDTIFAGTGEAVQIPFTLVNSEYLDKYSIYNYRAYIRFNRTLIMPDKKYTEHYLDQYERVIIVEGTRPGISGILENLQFTALWGNAECTDIVIDSVVWNENDVIVDIDNGVFCIDDLCNVNGTRLYLSSQFLELSQNRPNPASYNTKIEMRLIEKGEHFLNIYDTFGNLHKSYSINSISKYEVIDLDLSDWSSGVYYYSLQTPTRTLTKQMLVVK